MILWLNWCLLLSSLFMVGCFSTFKYVPVKDYNSSVTYHNGFETRSSVKINEISLSKNNFFNTRSSRIAFNLKVKIILLNHSISLTVILMFFMFLPEIEQN